MEERNKIFRVVLGDQLFVFGKIIGRLGHIEPIENLRDVQRELQKEDFIRIRGEKGDLLISTKHIIGVEEV